jgi:uncharacterized protein (DUF2126 family)
MLYHGQGKWYPGEPLPRWLLAVFWRTDGRPVWHDASLLADTTKDYGHGIREAEAFAQELTERLGLATVYLQPGHEDTLYYIHAEQNLPAAAGMGHGAQPLAERQLDLPSRTHVPAAR